MKKISFIFLFSLALSTGNLVIAQTPADDLFSKVFGNQQSEKIVQLDVSYSSLYVGAIKARFVGEKLKALDGEDLRRVIFPLLREEKLPGYQFPAGFIDIAEFNKQFPSKLEFNSSELKLSLVLPAEDSRPRESKIFDDLLPYYSRQAVDAAPFSAAVNYKIEHTTYRNSVSQDGIAAETDFFSNIGKVGVESRQTYSDGRNQRWIRQNSRLVYDQPDRLKRFEAGDVSYPTLAYQQFVNMGGVAVYSEYALNPYRTFTPTSAFEYLIESRSLVKTYINGSLIKSEYMSPGRYAVRDIPLNNGINRIVLEITDEFGVTRKLNFNEASSIDLIAQGNYRYSLASGAIAQDTDKGKDYSEDVFTSGFMQYGLLRNWTAGIYSEGSRKYQMLGTNHIFATRLGSFSFDLVGNKNKQHTGFLSQVSYQLNLTGKDWYDTHTLTTKIEAKSPWYNASGEVFRNRTDWSAFLNYNLPLAAQMTLALGGNYQHAVDDRNSRLGYNGNLSFRFRTSSSLNANFSRTRDESRQWNDQLYFFLNFSFDDLNTYASVYYENESKSKRVTAVRDTGNRINDLKAVGTIEDSVSLRQGSLDLHYNTILADVGIREEITDSKLNGTSNKTSIRLLSAFAFVHNGDNAAFSVSRPITNSYVIFKPNTGWEGQKFGVQTISEANESEAGLFGEALVSGLSPYQYRRLQLNPLYLEPGYVLGQESFVVYPRRSSGHLFMVGRAGLKVIQGKMVNQEGEALSLKVGLWKSETGKTIPFFTGRNGEFLIEGIDADMGSIIINDENYAARKLELNKTGIGINDLGEITLPKNENAL